jgi:hypothetical protein
MKMENFHHRRMLLAPPSAEPIADRRRNLAGFFSANKQLARGRRKVFVIKQVRHPASTASDSGKTQRVLIFDNHPDSLRLVFALQARGQTELARSEVMSLWQFLLVATLTFGLVFGMFWPLILK